MMENNQTNTYMEETNSELVHTYNRFPVVLDHGEGVYLYDTEGKKYLDFAEYIISEGGCEDGNIFEMAYRDEIAPYEYPVTKAYEMMSCFEGLLEYYRATGNEKYRDAAIRFGYRILHTDVTVLGCCGCTNELFDNSTRMQTKISENGILQETCVTVTWMKMCFQLFRLTGDPVFTDAIEQSFCNAYLGSLNTHMTVKPERNSAMGVIAYMLMPFDSYSPLTAGVRGRRVGGRKFFDKYTYKFIISLLIGKSLFHVYIM